MDADRAYRARQRQAQAPAPARMVQAAPALRAGVLPSLALRCAGCGALVSPDGRRRRVDTRHCSAACRQRAFRARRRGR